MANLIEEITKIRQILEGEGGGSGDFTTVTVKIYNHQTSDKTIAIPHIVDIPGGLSAIAYLDAGTDIEPTSAEFVVPIYKNKTTYIELLNETSNVQFGPYSENVTTQSGHIACVTGDCELMIFSALG